MALDDLLEPEVVIAVAVTAAVASPPVRKALRKGLVYGLAALLTAGDKVAGAARNLAENAQNRAGTRGPAAAEPPDQPAPRTGHTAHVATS